MSRILSNLAFRRNFTTGLSCLGPHKKLNFTPIGGHYIPIYRLPQIMLCSLINKFKKYQLIASGTTIPASYGAYAMELCDGNVPVVVATVGLASTVAIFTIGQFFTRLVGYVYMSRNREEVKISYLDFWGNRKDEIVPVEDVLPLSHSPKYPTDKIYRKLFITSSTKPYKLSLKFGEVLDTEWFKDAFSFDPDADENLIK